MFRLVITTVFLGILSACSSTPEPVLLSNPEINAAPKGKTFTAWGEFVLDGGDVVNIIVEEMPNLNGIQKISPSGIISLPVIGMVRAKGLTESQLRESVYLKVRPHVKIPRVSLNVVQMNSYLVAFEGKIQKPGTIRFENRTTLQQGISTAGGVKGDGISRVTVVRDMADGTRKRFESSLKSLKDGVLDNFILERGDLVIVD